MRYNRLEWKMENNIPSLNYQPSRPKSANIRLRWLLHIMTIPPHKFLSVQCTFQCGQRSGPSLAPVVAPQSSMVDGDICPRIRCRDVYVRRTNFVVLRFSWQTRSVTMFWRSMGKVPIWASWPLGRWAKLIQYASQLHMTNYILDVACCDMAARWELCRFIVKKLFKTLFGRTSSSDCPDIKRYSKQQISLA
jgi:hypothetical protein